MNNTSSYGLRELAHKYYIGELEYDSYRHQRTQLLDRLTQQDDDDTNAPITRPMPNKSDASHDSGIHWLRSLLILIVLLITIITIIWMVKPGWLLFSQLRISHGIEITMIKHDQACCNDTWEL